MNIEVHSLQDFENSLAKTREEFYKTTTSIRKVLEDAVNLYFDLIDLIKNVAKDTDDERYTLEVLATAFRRVIGSIVLLESGLPQEAHILLRNTLELMLIAIDITYNKTSLEEWEKTVNDVLKSSNYEDWYFKKSKICKRIERNEQNIYPELERKLVLFKGVAGNGLCKEWEVISSMSVHAHSQAQIRKLFDKKGRFQLLARKTAENYKKDFKQYRNFIMNIIAILIGIPKYRSLIGKTPNISIQADKFAKQYSKLLKEIGITSKFIESQEATKKRVMTKSELAQILKDKDMNFDISSLPDNAIIEDYSFDLSNSGGPKISVAWSKPQNSNKKSQL